MFLQSLKLATVIATCVRILERRASTMSAREAMPPKLFVNVTMKASAAMSPMKTEIPRIRLNHKRTATASNTKAQREIDPNMTAATHLSISSSACFQP